MTRKIIWPYKMASESAANLAESLGARRVYPNGRYRPRRTDTIINWGNHTFPNWWTIRVTQQVLNLPQFVENASNKLKTLQLLGDSGNVPHYTTDINVARGWFATHPWPSKLAAVVCRILTRANSGRGIVLAKTPEEVVPAPLYTRYTPKSHEYRVHVFSHCGAVDVQEKRKVNGFVEQEGTNKYIRNHPNGWVFCRDDVNCPPAVIHAAEEAILTLNLDFGAVDIGWHEEIGAKIYEVNTAPGIEGTTLANYTRVFTDRIGR